MALATHTTEAPAPTETRLEPAQSRKPGGVHPVVIEIAMAAAIWFIAMAWLSFAWGHEVDLDLAVVTLFFVIFFTLFLTTASYAINDPRWQGRAQSFTSFLRDDDIAIDGGRMRGRDVLIEIALIPVALALAATLIGLAWVIFG